MKEYPWWVTGCRCSNYRLSDRIWIKRQTNKISGWVLILAASGNTPDTGSEGDILMNYGVTILYQIILNLYHYIELTFRCTGFFTKIFLVLR